MTTASKEQMDTLVSILRFSPELVENILGLASKGIAAAFAQQKKTAGNSERQQSLPLNEQDTGKKKRSRRRTLTKEQQMRFYQNAAQYSSHNCFHLIWRFGRW